MDTRKVFWWQKKGDELGADLYQFVHKLKERQTHVYEANKRHLRLYGQHLMLGLRASENTGMDYLPRLTLNVIQQGVDTAQARIAKNKPRPRFLTENGSYSLKRKGEKLGKFIEGVYYENETYQKTQRCFMEAGIFGTSGLKIYHDGKTIKHERVFIHEIVVDEDESIYGKPKSIYQIKYVNKHHLAELYPKFKDDILGQSFDATDEDFMVSSYDSDVIKCIEGFKLGLNGKPGKHAIVLNGLTLLEEPYKRDRLPYEFFRYRPRVIGFFGQGIAEVNTGLQIEINKLLRTIQLCLHLGAIPKIFVESSSDIVSTHINNKIGGIIKYNGTRPHAEQLMRVPPELFLQLDRLYEKSFQSIGLSTMSTSGTKPAGLNSGKALREYNDIESERFSIVAQDYENFHVNIWKHTIELAQDLAKEKPDLQVTSLDKDGIETIVWKDVQIEKDKYILQVYPVNMLSKDPSGKLSDVKMLMDMQMVDPEEGMELLDFPDINRFYRMKNAKRFNIWSVVDRIVENAEYEPPSPMQDLEYGIESMQNLYLFYKNEGLESDKLELFTRWVSDALALLNPEPIPEALPESEIPQEQEALPPEELVAENAALEQEIAGQQLVEEELPLLEEQQQII